MNPFAWVRNRIIEKAVRRATIRLIGENMQAFLRAIMWIANAGGFLSGKRSQILAAVKGILAALNYFHVSLPFDVQAVDELLNKLITWSLTMKAGNFFEQKRRVGQPGGEEGRGWVLSGEDHGR